MGAWLLLALLLSDKEMGGGDNIVRLFLESCCGINGSCSCEFNAMVGSVHPSCSSFRIIVFGSSTGDTVLHFKNARRREIARTMMFPSHFEQSISTNNNYRRWKLVPVNREYYLFNIQSHTT